MMQMLGMYFVQIYSYKREKCNLLWIITILFVLSSINYIYNIVNCNAGLCYVRGKNNLQYYVISTSY